MSLHCNSRHRRRALIAALEPLERRALLAGELLVNGDFAGDSSGWTLTGSFRADATYSTTAGRSNPGYAYLAGANGSQTTANSLTGVLSQAVAIPAAGNSTLTFYYRNTSSETVAPPSSNDRLYVQVKRSDGSVTTLSTLYGDGVSMTTYASGGSFSLNAFAGQTVTLQFNGITDFSGPTVFRVDDVSVYSDLVTALTPPVGIVPYGTGTAALKAAVPFFDWNAVSGAEGYGVLLQKYTPGTATWANVWNSESTFGTLQYTSLNGPAGLATGSYRWAVRATAGGAFTSYSGWLPFDLSRNSAGTNSAYNRVLGVDVSHYQATINWTSYKNAGVRFAWTKATEDDYYSDTYMVANLNGARAAGIAVSAYHFARPDGTTAATITADAIAEATYYVNRIKPYLKSPSATGAFDGSMPPALDLEDNGGLTKANLKIWVDAWMSYVFNNDGGIVPLIYTGKSFASTNVSSNAAAFTVWMAAYPGGTDPQVDELGTTTPWGDWNFWQYNSAFSTSPGGDSDVFDGDLAALYAMQKPPAASTTLTATVFNDFNANGTKDSNEPYLSGVTAYVDLDGDGVLDTNEPTAATNTSGVATVATGQPVGVYRLRLVTPSGAAAYAPDNIINVTDTTATRTATFGVNVLPVLAASSFSAVVGPAVTLQYSEPVTINASNTFTATNLTNGQIYTFNRTANNTTTFAQTFSAATGYSFPDGNYRLTLAPSAVKDGAASSPTATSTLDFYWLNGDANRDRTVDTLDFAAVVANFGLAGRNFTQGDFDGSTGVDSVDFNVLVAKYGTSVPSTAPGAPVTLQAARATSTPFASQTAIAPLGVNESNVDDVIV